MKRALVELYLEWVNDYLTMETMAEHHKLAEDDLRTLVSIGKRLHEKQVIAGMPF